MPKHDSIEASIIKYIVYLVHITLQNYFILAITSMWHSKPVYLNVKPFDINIQRSVILDFIRLSLSLYTDLCYSTCIHLTRIHGEGSAVVLSYANVS